MAEKKSTKDKTKPESMMFNVTMEQLDEIVKKRVLEEKERIIKETTERVISKTTVNAVDTVIELILALPAEVLRQHYWKKTYKQKLPEFTKLLCEYYDRWSRDDIDLDRLLVDLKEDTGIQFMKEEKVDERPEE